MREASPSGPAKGSESPMKGPGTPLSDSVNGEEAPETEPDAAGDINDNLIPSGRGARTAKSSLALNKNLKHAPKALEEEGSTANHHHHPTEEVVLDGYYRDLVKLVNQQREKICAQQVDLTKVGAPPSGASRSSPAGGILGTPAPWGLLTPDGVVSVAVRG